MPEKVTAYEFNVVVILASLYCDQFASIKNFIAKKRISAKIV